MVNVLSSAFVSVASRGASARVVSPDMNLPTWQVPKLFSSVTTLIVCD